MRELSLRASNNVYQGASPSVHPSGENSELQEPGLMVLGDRNKVRQYTAAKETPLFTGHHGPRPFCPFVRPLCSK
jgi:hypothetical protein